MEQLFALSGIYLVAATLLVCCIEWLRPAWRTPRHVYSAIARNRLLLSWSLGLTCGAFLLSPPMLRILPDELYLLSVSQSFHQTQTAYTTLAHTVHDVAVQPKIKILPVRPLLHPLLVSIVHFLRGYSWRNVFVVNFLALWGLLFLSGILGRRTCGAAGIFTAPLLVLSVPSVVLWATTGGLDILACLLSAVVMFSLWSFLRTPRQSTFSLLLASLTLAGHVRYETFLLTILLLAALGASGYLRASYFQRAWWITGLYVLTFLFSIAQRVLTLHYSRNEFAEASGLKNPVFFSGSFFFSHVVALLRSLFSPFSDSPYAQLLNCIVVLSLIALGREIFSRASGQRKLEWLLLSILPVCNLLLYLSYVDGDAELIMASRYYLQLSICLALGPLAIRLIRKQWMPSAALVAITALSLSLAWPKLSKTSEQGNATRIFNAVAEAVSDRDPSKVMIISPQSWYQFYTLLGFASQSDDWAKAHPDEITALLRSKDPPEIYSVSYEVSQPSGTSGKAPKWDGEHRFLLSLVHEKPSPNSLIAVRISRLGLAQTTPAARNRRLDSY